MNTSAQKPHSRQTPKPHTTQPNIIRYPILLSRDTLRNRLAALTRLNNAIPKDQYPVLVRFVEKKH